MKTETRKISDGADHLSAPLGAERMSGIRAYRNPSQCFLQFAFRLKYPPFPFHDRKDAVVIAGHAADIHGNYRFRLFVDRVFQRVVIHFQPVFLRIDQNEFRSHMTRDGSRSRIRIRGRNHFVARAYAQ